MIEVSFEVAYWIFSGIIGLLAVCTKKYHSAEHSGWIFATFTCFWPFIAIVWPAFAFIDWYKRPRFLKRED